MVQGIHGENEGVQGFGVPEARKIEADGCRMTGFSAFPPFHEPCQSPFTGRSMLRCRAQGAKGQGGFFDAGTNSCHT